MSGSPTLDRRDFLKSGAALGVALVIGFHLDARTTTDRAQAQERPPENPFDAWVRITPDNRVTVILAKSEMGQGAMTALPMILAEELCVDWKEVKVEQAPTNPKIYDHGTGGSGSVTGSWLPLRRAGAAGREMLISAAAARWSVNRDTCVAQDGGGDRGMTCVPGATGVGSSSRVTCSIPSSAPARPACRRPVRRTGCGRGPSPA